MSGQFEEKRGQAHQHLAAGDKDADGDQLMLSVENIKTQPMSPTQPLLRLCILIQIGAIGAAPEMQKNENHTYVSFHNNDTF